MTAAEIQSLLTQTFPDAVTGANLENMDPWIEIAPASVVPVARFLKSDARLLMEHLNDLTVVDYLQTDPAKLKKFGHEPHLEVVYHLSSYTHRHKIVIKIRLPRWKNDTPGEIPELDSVSSVWRIADWHEREAFDLGGVRFNGHPNLRRILCAEDWVGHPLRKDYEFPLEYHGIRGR